MSEQRPDSWMADASYKETAVPSVSPWAAMSRPGAKVAEGYSAIRSARWNTLASALDKMKDRLLEIEQAQHGRDNETYQTAWRDEQSRVLFSKDDDLYAEASRTTETGGPLTMIGSALALAVRSSMLEDMNLADLLTEHLRTGSDELKTAWPAGCVSPRPESLTGLIANALTRMSRYRQDMGRMPAFHDAVSSGVTSGVLSEDREDEPKDPNDTDDMWFYYSKRRGDSLDVDDYRVAVQNNKWSLLFIEDRDGKLTSLALEAGVRGLPSIRPRFPELAFVNPVGTTGTGKIIFAREISLIDAFHPDERPLLSKFSECADALILRVSDVRHSHRRGLHHEVSEMCATAPKWAEVVYAMNLADRLNLADRCHCSIARVLPHFGREYEKRCESEFQQASRDLAKLGGGSNPSFQLLQERMDLDRVSTKFGDYGNLLNGLLYRDSPGRFHHWVRASDNLEALVNNLGPIGGIYAEHRELCKDDYRYWDASDAGENLDELGDAAEPHRMQAGRRHAERVSDLVAQMKDTVTTLEMRMTDDFGQWRRKVEALSPLPQDFASHFGGNTYLHAVALSMGEIQQKGATLSAAQGQMETRGSVSGE